MQKVLVLHDFMLNDKKLKGTKLLVYAFIYSYHQIPDSIYYVSWANACKFLGISKSSYFDALKWLSSNKYLSNNFTIYEVDNDASLYKFDLNSEKIQHMIKIAQSKWVK